MGDNIFDINIDFEDLGDDQPIFNELKDVQEPSPAGSRAKPSPKKPATAQKKALNKNNKSILSSPESTKLKTSSTKLNKATSPAAIKNKNAELAQKPVISKKTIKFNDVSPNLKPSSTQRANSDFHKKPKNRNKRISLGSNSSGELKVKFVSKKLASEPKSAVENIQVKRMNLRPALNLKPSTEANEKPLAESKPAPKPEAFKNSGYSFGQLNHLCNLVRQDILDMLYHAGSGHSAGSLDQVEIMVALYFKIMRHDPNDPAWSQRDILIQSNGHTVPVRYAVMARAGYFPRSSLLSLRRFDSDLQGHPERMRIPALETTSGPLGSGLSQACGMALALMTERNITRRIYCTMGDGELNEGNIWEAAILASKYRLGNIIGIVDRNNIQIDGMAEDVMPMENLREKWEAFGWYVQEVDGNNVESVCSALNLAKSQTAKPNLIIAHTIPGKGVDFMEYDYHWHGKAPDKQQEQDAIKKLRTLDGKIEGGNL